MWVMNGCGEQGTANRGRKNVIDSLGPRRIVLASSVSRRPSSECFEGVGEIRSFEFRPDQSVPIVTRGTWSAGLFANHLRLAHSIDEARTPLSPTPSDVVRNRRSPKATALCWISFDLAGPCDATSDLRSRSAAYFFFAAVFRLAVLRAVFFAADFVFDLAFFAIAALLAMMRWRCRNSAFANRVHCISFTTTQ